MPDREVKIVGVGGQPRSGKDVLAQMFLEAGYFGLSFGDMIRVFSRQRYAGKPDPISRSNLTETANWLRATKGADVLLVETLKQYSIAAKQKDYKGVVLWAIRAPVEADYILSRKGRLIWVESSDKTRYERAMADLRVGEPRLSLAEFQSQEAAEWVPQAGTPAESQMSVSYVKAKATDTLVNDGGLDDFTDRAKQLINQIDNS